MTNYADFVQFLSTSTNIPSQVKPASPAEIWSSLRASQAALRVADESVEEAIKHRADLQARIAQGRGDEVDKIALSKIVIEPRINIAAELDALIGVFLHASRATPGSGGHWPKLTEKNSLIRQGLKLLLSFPGMASTLDEMLARPEWKHCKFMGIFALWGASGRDQLGVSNLALKLSHQCLTLHEFVLVPLVSHAEMPYHTGEPY